MLCPRWTSSLECPCILAIGAINMKKRNPSCGLYKVCVNILDCYNLFMSISSISIKPNSDKSPFQLYIRYAYVAVHAYTCFVLNILMYVLRMHVCMYILSMPVQS